MKPDAMSAVCDGHVHVGGHAQWYFPPVYVVGAMRRLGVRRWAVSSMSTTPAGFTAARKELETVLQLAAGQAVPVLWVSPAMLRQSPDLSRFDALPYRAIKVHGFDGWTPFGKPLQRLFAIAMERELPVVMHTGGASHCNAGAFERICLAFPTVKVVLCHGRPAEEAAHVQAHCPNVWIETSFMQVRDIRKVISRNGSDRILFGTDFPMDEVWFPNQSAVGRYRRRVHALTKAFGKGEFLRWSMHSFRTIYNTE